MGWGGARVGAGKKPQPKAPKSPFKVFPGQKDAPAAEIEMPKGLPENQQEFWRANAPLAIERRTLTPATVPAFMLLCELNAKKVLVGVKVDEGELGGLRVYAQLAKQVEGLMARFCLAPFGKPTDGGKKATTASNPFGALQALQ